MFFQKKLGEQAKKKIKFGDDKTFLTKVRKSLFSRVKKKKPLVYKYFLYGFVLVIFFFVLNFLLSFSTEKFGKLFLSPVMVDLQKDKNGFINFILIGAGGGDHDGANLTDTMILTSIDPFSKKVVMLSIPRDLFVDYDARYKSSRINEVFRDMILRMKNLGVEDSVARDQARKILLKQISEITGLEIPYFVQIDFAGFEKVVDSIGGVGIEVPETLVDTAYPDGNRGYETFIMKEGFHELDGETALKYARSRHSSSDFDRAARQQMIISAIKEKLLSSEVLTKPSKLMDIYKIVSENLETNLKIGEILTLGSMADEYGSDSISNFVLNDDWDSAGGFLTTPLRSDYGGAFVLIPYSGESDFSRIQLFSELIFKNRQLLSVNFEILNGTQISGVATSVANRLTRYGFGIDSIGNSKEKNLSKTRISVYTPALKSDVFKKFWQEIFPGVEIDFVDRIGFYDETDIDCTIEVGENIKF